MSSKRFEAALESDVMKEENVIRAKGTMWMDCAAEMITDFDLAGASISLSADNEWFVNMANSAPETWSNMDDKFKQQVMKDFQGENGDKRQEMVFIGQNMNKQRIRNLMDSCLLTDEELAGDWENVENPFELYSEEEEMEISVNEGDGDLELDDLEATKI